MKFGLRSHEAIKLWATARTATLLKFYSQRPAQRQHSVACKHSTGHLHLTLGACGAKKRPATCQLGHVYMMIRRCALQTVTYRLRIGRYTCRLGMLMPCTDKHVGAGAQPLPGTAPTTQLRPASQTNNPQHRADASASHEPAAGNEAASLGPWRPSVRLSAQRIRPRPTSTPAQLRGQQKPLQALATRATPPAAAAPLLPPPATADAIAPLREQPEEARPHQVSTSAPLALEPGAMSPSHHAVVPPHSSDMDSQPSCSAPADGSGAEASSTEPFVPAIAGTSHVQRDKVSSPVVDGVQATAWDILCGSRDSGLLLHASTQATFDPDSRMMP